MASSSFQIRLVYRRRGAEREEALDISADDFFDPLEPGEEADCDSAPRHLEMATYSDATPAELDWLRLSIHKLATGERRTLEERYWGPDASCRTSVLSDIASDGTVDSERVVQIVDPESGASHVMRFGPSDDETPAGLRSHQVFWTDSAGEEQWKTMA